MQRAIAISASLFVVAVLSQLAAQEIGDTKKKKEMPAEARLVSEQFANAWLVKQDLDGVMKLSAVPAFWWSHVKSGESVLLKPTVVRTLEDLKKEYAAELAKHKPVKGTVVISSPITYEDFRGRTSDGERSAFDEVLKKDDWIVGFQATSDDRIAAVVFLVARRDEKWKVIGHLRTDVIVRTKKKVGADYPLAKEIVAAWEKAGAAAGWLGFDEYRPVFHLASQPALTGAVPGFGYGQSGQWREGVVAALPAPEQPFGLNLSFSKVTDAGLKELAGLKSLQTLDLRYTQVTGAGLKELSGLKLLTTLNLRGTPVTDKGLKELAGLTQLTYLDLDTTHVTDAGLKELARLKSLQTLILTNTQGKSAVTDAGVAELRKALRYCKILR